MDSSIILHKENQLRSIIYLYEHEQIRNPSELLKYDSSGVMVDSMFEETWLRLVVKQATGTGKTKGRIVVDGMVLFS